MTTMVAVRDISVFCLDQNYFERILRELPNLAQGFANGLVKWYGLGAIMPLNDFISAPDYGVDEAVYGAIFAGPLSSGTLPDGRHCAYQSRARFSCLAVLALLDIAGNSGYMDGVHILFPDSI